MNTGNKMNSKPLEERVSFLEGKIEVLINQVNERLRGIEIEISNLRNEMNENINNLRNEMSAKIDSSRSETKSEINSLRNEIKELNDKMDNQFKWLIGLIVASWLIPILLRFFFP
ncbi:MAG: DUF1640 domain-containing protein [Thaumarchaeota archaeon]|nr:DUF1640 domain-containing protein [Nitrososphaerota archaeon]